MVIVLEAKDAVRPAGKPVAVPIPVTPVVERVMGVRAVLMQSVGEDDAAPIVLTGDTVIVPVTFAVPQPPVVGML